MRARSVPVRVPLRMNPLRLPRETWALTSRPPARNGTLQRVAARAAQEVTPRMMSKAGMSTQVLDQTVCHALDGDGT